MVVLFLFIDFGNVKFFTKTLIIISISTDIYWPYVCDPLGPYISLVNDSINPITLTDLSYQLTISKYKQLAKQIDKLSRELGGCQATPSILGDM